MKPLLTVCCTAYNQEKYIADAIESFLMQETDFDYEIIIHDDASNDRTAEIISYYAAKYPEIIKPILQKENKYSKGIGILTQIILPNADSKYIATCEGDDYWIDRKKLQKQVDFLENNPGYSLCFHSVAVVSENKKFVGRYYGPKGSGDRDCTLEECAREAFIHLSSRVILKEYVNFEKPPWMKHSFHGDYVMAFYLAEKGKVRYIDSVMSAYRTQVKGSMMYKLRQPNSRDRKIKYLNNRIKTLEMANEYYEYKYDKQIKSINLKAIVELNLLNNQYNRDAMKNYNNYAATRGIVNLIKLITITKLPFISKSLIKIKTVFMSKEISNN